jgi:hypothetical protein
VPWLYSSSLAFSYDGEERSTSAISAYYYVWGAALRRHIDPYTANLDPLARELGVFIKAGAKAAAQWFTYRGCA